MGTDAQDFGAGHVAVSIHYRKPTLVIPNCRSDAALDEMSSDVPVIFANDIRIPLQRLVMPAANTILTNVTWDLQSAYQVYEISVNQIGVGCHCDHIAKISICTAISATEAPRVV